MKTVLVIVTMCLLARPAHAQIPDFTPQTPLIGALLHNDLAEARRLVERGADPNEGTFNGMPPLFLAITRQDRELVGLMAAHGADLDARDKSGSTALMWAAFNEYGDAAIVEDLLARGADPSATNRRGETALVWASRRGETAATVALRKAGASADEAIRTAVQKSVALLQRSGSQFSRASNCYSCHHQSLPLMALAAARTRGIPIDEAAAREQIDATIAALTSVREQALGNRDRIPDPPLSVSYALMGLAASHYEPDETTAAMVRVISAWQSADGAFHPLPAIRPPLEADSFTATALSLRAIQSYAGDSAERVSRAREWLRTAVPRTTEERAFQLLGLVWSQASSQDVAAAATALAAAQRPDGGWAQLASLETDAYATGQALVALRAAGYALTSLIYQQGIAFLVRTQLADGSWHVRSRSFPVQAMRDSGFPHGKDQWISAAGTSWAVMALAPALPAETPSRSAP